MLGIDEQWKYSVYSKVNHLLTREVYQDRTAAHENFVKNNITDAKKYSVIFLTFNRNLIILKEIQ
jgi:hypothetical protein